MVNYQLNPLTTISNNQKKYSYRGKYLRPYKGHSLTKNTDNIVEG